MLGLHDDTDSDDEDPFTVVVTDAVLFAVFESETLPVTDAEFVIVPATVGVTTIVIVALPPFVIVPRLQLTVAPPVHVPSVVATDLNVVPEGNASVTLTPGASLPVLVTPSV